MKLFINSVCLFSIGAALLAGCSDSTSAPSPAPATPEKTEQPQPVRETAPQPTPVAQPTQPVSAKLTEQEVINRFKAWDQKLLFLTTSFTQTTSYDGVQVNRSAGTLTYDKAHQLLRLDTKNDDGTIEQSAITDKKEIIILDENSQQVTTLSWEQWQQGQPNQALFDFGNYTALINKHQVKMVKPNQLALTPLEGEPYTLYVTLSDTDYFPTELTIEADLLVTKATLTQTKKNIPFDSGTVFGGFFK